MDKNQLTSDLVLVTGASGYIATHVVKTFQEAGYKVRGTIRNAKDEQKVKTLEELCPGAKHPLELVEADLLDATSWKAAVEGCTHVIHVASPFVLNVQHEDEVIRPAVDGTLNVLKACKEEKTVQKVVLTSSCVAVAVRESAMNKAFTESDWTDETLEDISPYMKSKTLAERAAWDYVKGLEEGEKFDLIVINPSLVLGPVLCGTIGTSIDIMKSILENTVSFPWPSLTMVDVRDVALAHLKAISIPETVGNRHIVHANSLWFADFITIVRSEFKHQGYPVPKIPDPTLGQHLIKYDNSRMKNVLGIVPRNTKDTIIDMCYSMIERGIVKKASGYKGRK